MGPRETTFLPFVRTSKKPLRGFSGLITTTIPSALRRPSSLTAALLNTPHEVQRSISTSDAPLVAALPLAATMLYAGVRQR